MFCKEGVLRSFAKFTGKHLYQSFFFSKKDTLAQVFSCEFCNISMNSLYYRTPPVAVSVACFSYFNFMIQKQSLKGILKKNVFLNISQISQENTTVGVCFFNKVSVLRLQHCKGVFLWNFAKFLRTPFYGMSSGNCFFQFYDFNFFL